MVVGVDPVDAGSSRGVEVCVILLVELVKFVWVEGALVGFVCFFLVFVS